MKTVHALLIAALFTATGCKEQESVKPGPAAKTGDPVTPTPTPTQPEVKAEVTPLPTPAEPPSAAPTPGGSIDAAGARALDIADRFARTVADAGDDCEKVGVGLKALSVDLQAAATEQAEMLKDEHKRNEFSRKFQTPLNAKLKPALAVIQKCAQNPEVKGVFEMLRK